MKALSNLSNNQAGIAQSAIIAIIAAVVIIGGVIFYTVSQNDSETIDESRINPTDKVSTPPQKVVQPTKKKQVVDVDADTFCNQLAAVGEVFGKELTGASVRANASFGPKAGCSWNGPSVTVYFGNNSYQRMSTGFGSDIYVNYDGTDLPAYTKETSTSRSGIEVHVKSDKGWAISINDGRGLKEHLTPAQYNQIANLVNDALNQHY